MSARFAAVFDRAPDGVWAAPGRLNVIGEFTDYNDGLCLPMALEQVTTATVAARADDIVRLYSSELDADADATTFDLSAPRLGRERSWTSYALGVISAMRDAGLEIRGADVLIDSNVPIGAGLSSSAALECALALALRDLYAPTVSRRELALACQRAENLYVGVPSGIMDQTASLFCHSGNAILFDTRSGEIEQLPFDLAANGLQLLVIDTRVRRELASSAYAERRAACERAARAMGVPALRDAELSDLERVLDPIDYKRARHVITDDARVLQIAALMRHGEYERVGPILSEAHLSLRDDFEVSCAELDSAAASAVLAGALGARMIGGGFGGCVVALVREKDRQLVQAGVEAAFAAAGFVPPTCFSALPAPGARRLE